MREETVGLGIDLNSFSVGATSVTIGVGADHAHRCHLERRGVSGSKIQASGVRLSGSTPSKYPHALVRPEMAVERVSASKVILRAPPLDPLPQAVPRH